MNNKVYIHELIDIIGQNRAKYMHHMTANWSPIGQEEREQLCYGVWGVVGSTGQWPAVVNLWEEQGFDGLAESFGHETGYAGMQDPKLAKWWAEAAGYRRGGFDRIVVPAPWTRTIEELCADGAGGAVYAHEVIRTRPGEARDHLEHIADAAAPLYEKHGWGLIGAWETAMSTESECIVLWSIPTWDAWASAEQDEEADGPLRRWRRGNYERITEFERVLLVDAPLSPLRTGRQPSREDRVDNWDDL